MWIIVLEVGAAGINAIITNKPITGRCSPHRWWRRDMSCQVCLRNCNGKPKQTGLNVYNVTKTQTLAKTYRCQRPKTSARKTVELIKIQFTVPFTNDWTAAAWWTEEPALFWSPSPVDNPSANGCRLKSRPLKKCRQHTRFHGTYFSNMQPLVMTVPITLKTKKNVVSLLTLVWLKSFHLTAEVCFVKEQYYNNCRSKTWKTPVR